MTSSERVIAIREALSQGLEPWRLNAWLRFLQLEITGKRLDQARIACERWSKQEVIDLYRDLEAETAQQDAGRSETKDPSSPDA